MRSLSYFFCLLYTTDLNGFEVFQRTVGDHLTQLALVFTAILSNDTFLCTAKHDLLPQNTVLGSAHSNYGT